MREFVLNSVRQGANRFARAVLRPTPEPPLVPGMLSCRTAACWAGGGTSQARLSFHWMCCDFVLFCLNVVHGLMLM